MKNHYKFWIVFSFIVVFFVGIVGGVLLEKQYLSQKIERKERRKSPARFPTLETMAKELNLSSEQEDDIREIFKNNDERLKALRKQIHQQLSSIRMQLKKEINFVLTEEQKVKFEAMIEHHLSQMKREREDRKNGSGKNRNTKGEEK
ncbi:MAG: hypothetical protein U9O50_02140 [Acidobacteriota bacterium]|nr:hypothetical protein [Acidobacteriota bacterium]